MSINKCLILLILLTYLFGYVIFLSIFDIIWVPKKPSSHKNSLKYRSNGLLILNNDKTLQNIKYNGLLISALPKSPFKKLDLKTITKKLVPSQEFIQLFKYTAKLIYNKQLESKTANDSIVENNFVSFTIINYAFLNLSLNWLCNIHALDAMKHKKFDPQSIQSTVLIVALDNGKICNRINKDWPKIKCLSFEAPLFFKNAIHSVVGQIYFFSFRAYLLAALAEINVPFVAFETDSVWLRNPMTNLFSKQRLINDADLVLPLNPRYEMKFGHDPILGFPTKRTRRALQELRRRLARLSFENVEDLSRAFRNAESMLNHLCETQYMNLVCREFDFTNIANGKWFLMSELEQKKTFNKSLFIAANNFNVEIENKKANQAFNSVWFLTSKNFCLISKAQRMISKFYTL